MKRFRVSIVLLCGLLLLACGGGGSGDGGNSGGGNNPPGQTASIVGTWVKSSFSIGGPGCETVCPGNSTCDVPGIDSVGCQTHVATFNSDGTVSITENNVTKTGTWSENGNTLTVIPDDPADGGAEAFTCVVTATTLTMSWDEPEGVHTLEYDRVGGTNTPAGGNCAFYETYRIDRQLIGGSLVTDQTTTRHLNGRVATSVWRSDTDNDGVPDTVGSSAAYTYDARNNLETQNVEWSYGGVITRSTNNWTYVYDADGNPLSIVKDAGTYRDRWTNTYNANGDYLTRLWESDMDYDGIYESSMSDSVSYSYNAQNQMTQRVRTYDHGGVATATFTYYADGKLESRTFQTSGSATVINQVFTYNADGTMDTWTETGLGQRILSEYSYDATGSLVGLLTTWSDGAGAITGQTERTITNGDQICGAAVPPWHPLSGENYWE